MDELFAGEVGYFSGAIKEVADARVGDTVTSKKGGASQALPGYQVAKPMVFCGALSAPNPLLVSACPQLAAE